MSERALRGTRLGATSYETDSGIDLAPRQDVEYSCPNGHRFEMPFALEADVPATWECRVCGAQALRVDGEAPEAKPGKPVRTHWDMLLERRSVADLEEVLAERLEVLRGGGIAYAAKAAPELVDAASGVPSAARSTTVSRPSGGAPRPSAKNTAPTKKSTAAAPATRSAGKAVKKSPTAKSPAGK
jgi:RNA polymerase-binding protein